jgi:phage terminase large subunit-like protein
MAKMDPKVAQLIATSQGRRMLSAASPSFFDSYYLGLEQPEFRKHWLDTIEELQKECLDKKQKKKLLVLAPRNHGKSTLAISFILRQICLNRNISILYISATLGQAEKRVRVIKEFLDDEKIQADFCQYPYLPFFGPGSKETASQLYVTRPGKSQFPTLEACGLGTAITGNHVDIVILDDVDTPETTNSPALRAKTREWLGATLIPIMNVSSMLLAIGTRKNSQDLYDFMLNDPTYNIIHDQAILEWPTSYEYIYERDKTGKDLLKGVKLEGGKALWPEHRPLDYLLMEKRTMGSLLFEREMQNNCIDSEDAIIKDVWIKSCLTNSYTFDHPPPLLKLDKCNIIQAWDLALQTDAKKAQKNDNDWSVGWTMAKDNKTGIIWVLDAMRFRGVSQQTLVDNIEKFYDKWGDVVHKVVVETNAFGALYFDAIKARNIPLRGVKMTAKNNLKNGIHKIAQKFETGLIRLPIGDNICAQFVEYFTDEAIKFPFGKHDDTLTSMLHCLNEIDSVFHYEISVGSVMIDENGEIEGTTEYHDPNSLEAFWSQFKQMDEDYEDDKALRSKDFSEKDWRKTKNKDGRSKQKVQNQNYGKPIAFGLDPSIGDDEIYDD